MPANLAYAPKRILIIKLRHHGDVLLTTPVASALKKTYPEAQIDALLYEETIDILRYNNDFTNLYSISRKWKKLGFRKHLSLELSLLNTLRQNHYDLIIHLTSSWRGAIISRYCAPKKSISCLYYGRDKGFWKRSFTDIVPWEEDGKHTVDLHLNTLTPLGINYNPREPLKLLVANKDAVSVSQKLTKMGWDNRPYVLIHPAARWFFKCWDDKKIADLIKQLLEHKQTVVLTGGPGASEKEMLNNIKALVGERERLYDLSGQLSLAELAAAIAQAKLFVGVDSVPMHMAAALNIPGVALFGATKIQLWRPWGHSIHVIDAREFGEIPDPDGVDTNTDERYLSHIPLDIVWQEVQKKLQEASKSTTVSHRKKTTNKRKK